MYIHYKFLIRKIRYVDTPIPPPVLYGVYTIPYNTYNYTHMVLANPTQLQQQPRRQASGHSFALCLLRKYGWWSFALRQHMHHNSGDGC